jgi:hypothetical protein
MSTTRGSQFSRVIRYFREADTVEAEACLVAATKVLAERKRAPAKASSTTSVKRGRPKTNTPAAEPGDLREETLSDA